MNYGMKRGVRSHTSFINYERERILTEGGQQVLGDLPSALSNG